MKIEYQGFYFESFTSYPGEKFFNERGIEGWIFCGCYPGYFSMPSPLGIDGTMNHQQGLNFIFYRELKEPVDVPAN